MSQRHFLVAVAVLSVTAAGCAISDYDGVPKHKTFNEAKLFGQEVSFTGTGVPAYDGTYSYTVNYDNSPGQAQKVDIVTYRNPEEESFNRDGVVDRDGDDLNNGAGDTGGRFSRYWVYQDTAVDCQFTANIKDAPKAGLGSARLLPGLELCNPGFLEEVDNHDRELQASFASVGDLLSQVWSGALTGGFTAELTGAKLAGTQVTLSQAVSIHAAAQGSRPGRISIDVSQPGARELIQAILDNTQNHVAVPVELQFSGGMKITPPNGAKVAFDHDVLFDVLH